LEHIQLAAMRKYPHKVTLSLLFDNEGNWPSESRNLNYLEHAIKQHYKTSI
jgi:hypothetical protein